MRNLYGDSVTVQITEEHTVTEKQTGSEPPQRKESKTQIYYNSKTLYIAYKGKFWAK